MHRERVDKPVKRRAGRRNFNRSFHPDVRRRRLAQRLGVDMPVTGTMYSVLYEGFAPREAVQALMGRQLKEE